MIDDERRALILAKPVETRSLVERRVLALSDPRPPDGGFVGGFMHEALGVVAVLDASRTLPPGERLTLVERLFAAIM